MGVGGGGMEERKGGLGEVEGAFAGGGGGLLVLILAD